MARRSDAALTRQWQLVRALSAAQYGLTMRQLCERLEGESRSSLYRELGLLRNAGVPIDKDKRNGEVRYRLNGNALPALTVSGEEAAALGLAARALAPLLPTAMGRVLSGLIQRYSTEQTPKHILVATSKSSNDEVLRALDSAIRNRCRVQLEYRGAKDETPRLRVLDPVALRLLAHELYLDAFDLQARRWKTFKLVRATGIEVLRERATAHGGYDSERLYRHAVKTWHGETVRVGVRLSQNVSRFVHEWPLHAEQKVTSEQDGSVVVRAAVNGLVEASRWVLSWGKDAQAVEPAQFVAFMQRELAAAIENYSISDPLGVKPAKQRKPELRSIFKQGVSENADSGGVG